MSVSSSRLAFYVSDSTLVIRGRYDQRCVGKSVKLLLALARTVIPGFRSCVEVRDQDFLFSSLRGRALKWASSSVFSVLQHEYLHAVPRSMLCSRSVFIKKAVCRPSQLGPRGGRSCPVPA